MNFTPTQLLIWIIGIVLEIVLLFRVAPYRPDLPAFATYCLYCFLRSTILLAFYLAGNHAGYFIAYWIGIGLGVVFLLLVVRECLAHALRPYFDIPGDIWGGALTLAILFGAFGAAIAGASMPGSLPHWIMTVLGSMHRIIVFVLLAVFGYLLIFPYSIRLQWQNPSQWLVLGFVISQGSQVMGILLGGVMLGKLGFLLAQMVWIAVLRGKEQSSPYRPRSPLPLSNSW